MNNAVDSELGKKTEYEFTYNPNKLFPIARQLKRDEIGVDSNNLPFRGYDLWNHYEVSWLNTKGKPQVAIAQIYYDCNTSHIIESKSLKLYFNSFNNSKFNSSSDLEKIIAQDLAKSINGDVVVKLYKLSDKFINHISANFDGVNIDNQDIECTEYSVNPQYLSVVFDASDAQITEALYSDLLKSNCLVTNQPDWGSVQIIYTGKKIDRAGLLKYIVSFRNHNEFHEQCIERIFVDILQYCKPQELTVIGRYTRRGGLDINPYRTNKTNKKQNIEIENLRLVRQ
jgi:7-cyano-7-deazaguanine reductase